MTNDQRPFRTINDLIARNKAAGLRFFDKPSLRFFRSRVSSRIYPCSGGAFFVTSERNESPYNTQTYPRLYTVRRMTLDGRTETVGEFQEHLTLKAAHRAASKAAKEAS